MVLKRKVSIPEGPGPPNRDFWTGEFASGFICSMPACLCLIPSEVAQRQTIVMMNQKTEQTPQVLKKPSDYQLAVGHVESQTTATAASSRSSKSVRHSGPRAI